MCSWNEGLPANFLASGRRQDYRRGLLAVKRKFVDANRNEDAQDGRDVAQDSEITTGRRVRRAGGLVLAIVTTLLLGSMLVWPVINDVATGTTPEYPDIQPQTLRFSPELVVERAVETVEQIPRWTVRDVDRDAGEIHAEAKSRLFGFTDDVTVTIEPSGAGCVVNVRSASRIGRGDFGQNARNIRLFQSSLEANLALATPTDE